MINIHSSEVIVTQILMCLLFSCWLHVDQILIFNKHCCWFNWGTSNIVWGIVSLTILSSKAAQLLGPIVNIVCFWQGWEGSALHWILVILSETSRSVVKVIQHLQVLDCKKKKKWKKKKEYLWGEKVLMKCPLKSPYFLIIALYCSCPNTFPTDSASSLTCLWQAYSEKKNWPALRWDEVPAPALQNTVDICYLICPLFLWLRSQLKCDPQWPTFPEL